MKVHLVGLPHYDPTRVNEHCAYASKLRRLTDMLAARGIDTVTYCGTGFDGSGQHVPVVGPELLDRWFGGPWDTAKVFDRWNPDDPCWVELNAAAVAAMQERIEPGDIVGLTMGRCQRAIVDAFPGHIACEVGVGYEGVIDSTHHCFESNTWRHYVSGRRGWDDGRNFDTVIPNAFDPDDYTTGTDGGYLLFLGRHTPRKGIAVVAELAKTHHVISAGQEGPVPGIEYRGLVVGDAKRELLAHATAVLVPTLYVEPFGGVAVEAMLAGVPAITTDFGAFAETVDDGITGFRCSTLGAFHDGVHEAPFIRGQPIRDHAISRFGTATVSRAYAEWFARCELLHGDGWYSQRGAIYV